MISLVIGLIYYIQNEVLFWEVLGMEKSLRTYAATGVVSGRVIGGENGASYYSR